MKKQNNLFLFHLSFLIFILMMTACSPLTWDPTETQTPSMEPQPTSNKSPTAQSSPTETTRPENTLTICTHQLPADLFPYSKNNAGNKSNLLSLLYEEPFSIREGEFVSVILEKVPSLRDGDLILEPVTVQAGQPVVDSSGQVKILKLGLQVRPSGCRDSDCAITWDGESPLEMDQMVVNFQIREDLAWSDGVPVKADDSVFSFETAANLQHAGSAWAIDRTQSYQAIDQIRLQWRGLPGFSTADLSQIFWKPLAAHLYQAVSSERALEGNEEIHTYPVGYGPFFVSAWDEGLLKFSLNANYFRMDEGLPKFDQIQVRQVDGGLQEAWLDLQNGVCDVLDSTFNLYASTDLLGEIQSDPEFDLLVENGESWMQLVFGIQPASHDEFYNPELGDRPDYLGDVRTRQAIMHCLDRETMLGSTFEGMGEVWQSYLPGEESGLGSEQLLNYDPARGIELLQSVGWFDLDGNPSTPLQSWYVPNVPDGEPLNLELLVDSNPLHQVIAEAIQANLLECGVGVTVKTLPVETLYAPGPKGPLFGRRFDLALISWQSMSGGDCQLYQSWNMPSDENYWIGTNIAGLLNESYDRACADAVLALPEEKVEADREAELDYLNSLPAVPLFSIPKIMVIPASGCADFEISSEEDFFEGISTFGIGEMCP
jgi:peptide/nickel transport system substrate-binding protein